MSFKLLKKQSEDKSRIDTLVNKLEKQEKKNYDDPTFWDLTKEKDGTGTAIIRFLPTTQGDSDKVVPVVTLFYHAFRGKAGFYWENCRSTLAGDFSDDPCCIYNSKLYNTGDETLRKWVSANSKRKKHIICNILVVNDPAKPENNGKVFKFRMGSRILDKITATLKGNPTLKKKGFEPWDFWKGADFTYTSRIVDGQTSYMDSAFDAPSVIHFIDGEELSDKQIEEEVYAKQYSLDAEIAPDKFKSFDVLKARLDKCLGIDSSSDVSSVETEEASVSEKKSAVTKKKVQKVEEEEEDEVLDFENSDSSLDADVDAIFKDLEIDV